MPDLPAHASPAFPPIASPRPSDLSRSISDLNLTQQAAPSAVSDPEQPTPALLQVLPQVHCEVRARIPTTTGQEMFLHLYTNNADNKEHLAIVFGAHIRSRSLDAPREGETEMDRMIRGAYVGTLYPGRTSSRVEQIRREAGVPPAPALPGSPVQMPDDRTDGGGGGGSSSADADADANAAPFVRIHSECYTGETAWSARCDCGEQLDEAARLMSLSPTGGVIVYLRQEGRGIGLGSKLMAYNLQDLGYDTMQANIELRHPADARSYGLATAMLMDLGLGGQRGIRLLTNNPEKVRAVEGPGREVRVVERVPMIPLAWKTGGKEGVRGPEVEKYISTKIEKFKHMFSA
ncbi:GTP cyclohydrolase II [Taxawa tesnikishii (nom. ined.)]|nr:GTP cyclohydrolase II [Dothideales sp. JES 119]